MGINEAGEIDVDSLLNEYISHKDVFQKRNMDMIAEKMQEVIRLIALWRNGAHCGYRLAIKNHQESYSHLETQQEKSST